MSYLLDTSVYCQPLRRKPVEACLLRWKQAGDAACGVSIVTVAEVEFGLNLENRMQRWEKYRGLLENRLEVIGSCAGVWSRFAKMKARQQELGAIVADLDLLIAATAAHYQRTVATLNSRDFSRIEGIAWEEWSAVS